MTSDRCEVLVKLDLRRIAGTLDDPELLLGEVEEALAGLVVACPHGIRREPRSAWEVWGAEVIGE